MLELTRIQTLISISNHEIVNKKSILPAALLAKDLAGGNEETVTQYLRSDRPGKTALGSNKATFSLITAALKKKRSRDGLQWNSYVCLCSW